MRAVLFLFLVSLAAAAQEPAAGTCFVSGRVLNAANGEPVRHARLLLRRTDNPAGGDENAGLYTTSSDDHGRFAMQGIPPGKYDFGADHSGFAHTDYGARRPGRSGATLTLEDGQRVSNVVFRMTPQAVISGRILDAAGDPVANAQITAERFQFSNGKKELMPADHSGSDDLGEYRMYGLAPGRYYLQAIFRNGEPFTENRAKPPAESYVPTYYPGVTDVSSATALDVAAGAQLRGVDFTISSTRAVTVSGHISGPEGVNLQRTMIVLLPPGHNRWQMMRRARVTDAQGSFQVTGVAPGSYFLTGVINDGKTVYQASQRLDVSGNVQDVRLSLSLGSELSGQVRFAGQPPADLTGIHVGLDDRQDYGFRLLRNPDGELKEDGSFTIQNIMPQVYDVRLSGLPDGYYLKSVRLGDDELKVNGLDATHELSGALLLTVSANAGRIEGTVRNAKDQPVPGALVVLVPPPDKRDRSEEFLSVTTDQYGRYLFRTVEPGAYKLFAWDDIDPGEYMDPEFLKPVEDRGAPVSIQDGSRETVDLKLVARK